MKAPQSGSNLSFWHHPVFGPTDTSCSSQSEPPWSPNTFFTFLTPNPIPPIVPTWKFSSLLQLPARVQPTAQSRVLRDTGLTQSAEPDSISHSLKQTQSTHSLSEGVTPSLLAVQLSKHLPFLPYWTPSNSRQGPLQSPVWNPQCLY